MVKFVNTKLVPVVIVAIVAISGIAYVVISRSESAPTNKPSKLTTGQSTTQHQESTLPFGTTSKRPYCLTTARLCFDIPTTWEKHSYGGSSDENADFWYNNTSGQFSVKVEPSSTPHGLSTAYSYDDTSGRFITAGNDCDAAGSPYTHGEVLTSEPLQISAVNSSGSTVPLYIGERIFSGSKYADEAEYFITADPTEAKIGSFTVNNNTPCPSSNNYIFTGSAIIEFGSNSKEFYPDSRQDAIDTMGRPYMRAGYWDVIKSLRTN